jgi:acyl carrier protein
MTEPAPWDTVFETVLRPLLPALPGDAVLREDLNLVANGLDSMASVELVLTLESSYAIQFPDELLHASSFATAGRLWHVVDQLRTGEG